jgi:cold shock CspA family protein
MARRVLVLSSPMMAETMCSFTSAPLNDVFVHISAVERAGLSSLAEGQRVSYEVKVDPRRGKSSAENLRV